MSGQSIIEKQGKERTVNPLKILVLSNDTTYTYNLRNEVLERLVNDGHEVVVVSKPLLLQDELKALGCRLIDLNTNRHGTNPISDLGLLMQFRRIIKAEKPDLVLTYNIKPNAYGGMACRMTKSHYIPNITGLGTALEYPGIMQKITSKLYKWGVAGADCVLFQNEENQRFFETHRMLRNGTRTRLLPGSGVSLKRHHAMPYPADDGKIHFLFIARIMQAKGIDLYLGAAKRIHEKHPNAVFHICGLCDDEKYNGLLKEAEKNGYILYHGEQKDMVPFFEMAHCIVHPSYYPEGMSNVLLEAAAHCRPIITTDRSGCRETVEDGKTGFVIPIKDEDALVNALERFLSMSWEQKRDMGLAGRAKVEREFDRQLVVEVYMDEVGKLQRDRL
jgi:galacturonosyltransferase